MTVRTERYPIIWVIPITTLICGNNVVKVDNLIETTSNTRFLSHFIHCPLCSRHRSNVLLFMVFLKRQLSISSFSTFLTAIFRSPSKYAIVKGVFTEQTHQCTPIFLYSIFHNFHALLYNKIRIFAIIHKNIRIFDLVYVSF